ncbi:GNAT family N-acetyltransferase [Spirosoma sp. HMF3257]|uniref:GNAT family N-acetyltransferase n=1 Tax=Spirosoma telluris TaxID=2183553 RepID=A0A327NRE5_9BACT|nr:GNAT family N-acetyltransferase [Spirosoma telluris]RAI75278.1 GNAT family N-acetyltransferase [Spirosoma telluris]
MKFSFRNDQTDVAFAVLREVGQWLVDNGQELWAIDTLTPENLLDEYTTGNFYVMYADREDGTEPEPAGVFILQWEDPLFWPDVPPNTSAFIHKLAIRRAFGGQNLFAEIIDFVRTECFRRDIKTFQLETDATRPKLMQFYERYGFQPTYQRQIHEFGQTFLCQFYVMTF